MNSTDTPGGSGIPAGWYDDPSGEGLRWWDGERWTEHVHTAESAAAASAAGEGEREGAPPRDLVRLRESIRGRGIKAVGIALGAALLVIVVIALLVSGGSEGSSGAARQGNGTPSAGQAAGPAAAARVRLRRIDRRLQGKNLSQAQREHLRAVRSKLRSRMRKLEKSAGTSTGQSGEGAGQQKE